MMALAGALAMAALAPMLAVTLWNLVAAPRLHEHRAARTGPRVSVLVPARDEEVNVIRSIPALLASGYADFEVVVLDDASEDSTRPHLDAMAARDARLRVVSGEPTPAGWTGKNWACHQLTRHATGEVLVFCDADVVAGPDALGRTVRALDDAGAALVTGLPAQRLEGWAAAALVPLVMHVAVAAVLPLALVARARHPSIVVGNGQWLAFRAAAYHRTGGHAAVRGDIVEDMALARRVKAGGGIVLPVIATHDLAVRMYGSLAGVREGFGKNLYALAGARTASALALLGAVLLTLMLPLLMPLHAAFWMLLAVRLGCAALFRHGLIAILLHPVGVALLVAIGIESAVRHRRGRLTWKRRVLATPATRG